MKRIAIFIAIVIIIVSGMAYLYLNYVANGNVAKKENRLLESYYNETIYGNDVATAINKAISTNESNTVSKTKQGSYIENDENSIKIDIKFTDNDKTYSMEEINNGGIEKFIQYYRNIKFKCTRIDYHEYTQKISYMYFEQVQE